jgi:hypothetical protein
MFYTIYEQPVRPVEKLDLPSVTVLDRRDSSICLRKIMSEIHLGGVTVLKFYVLHAVHFFDDLGSMRQMYTFIFYYSIHIFH